jgi:NAD(P)H-hydrate epimerase
MSGAVVLAGRAALTVGAGLVRLAVPDSILETVAAATPEVMTVPLRSDRRGRISLDAMSEITARCTNRVNVIAIGMGLGRSLGLSRLVERLYAEIPIPMIVDADALNALSERGIPASPPSLRIMTPHRGEFERLCPNAKSFTDTQSLETCVADFALRNNVVLVLKGVPTQIAYPTVNKNVTVIKTGNPGMATGGSGDVLTGIIAGLIAQSNGIGITPTEMIEKAVQLHGEAGNQSAQSRTEQSLTAGSIIEFIPEAIRKLNGGHQPICKNQGL